MDNGTFVDNMLDHIRLICDDVGLDTQLFLDSMRDHYTKKELNSSPFIGTQIAKVDLRVKDMSYVMDPMWYVVALHHRNKGGLWRDMHKYGVRSNNASSYKVDSPSTIN